MKDIEIEELIIEYLFKGYTQHEISAMLKEKGIKPNSLSSVEKKLKRIRDRNGAKTMFQLCSILTARINAAYKSAKKKAI